MKTEKEIEEMASKTTLHFVTNPTKATIADAWEEGYRQAQSDILTEASVSFEFEEDWNKLVENPTQKDFWLKSTGKELSKYFWTAARLSMMKENEELKSQSEEDNCTIDKLRRDLSTFQDEVEKLRVDLEWALKYSQGIWTETTSSIERSKEIRTRHKLDEKEGV